MSYRLFWALLLVPQLVILTVGVIALGGPLWALLGLTIVSTIVIDREYPGWDN